MTFRVEWALWLLVFVPIVAGLLVRNYRARAQLARAFGNPETVASLIRGRSPRPVAAFRWTPGWHNTRPPPCSRRQNRQPPATHS